VEGFLGKNFYFVFKKFFFLNFFLWGAAGPPPPLLGCDPDLCGLHDMRFAKSSCMNRWHELRTRVSENADSAICEHNVKQLGLGN